MLRSTSATKRTAWLSWTAWMVISGSFRELGWAGAASVDDAEALAPAELLAGGEGDLQEADRLEFAGPNQCAGVDDLEATGGEHVGEGLLGVGIVAGDQGGRLQRTDGALGQGAEIGRAHV